MGKWDALTTFKTPGTDFVDTGGSYHDQGFYRALAVEGTNVLTGDHCRRITGISPFTREPRQLRHELERFDDL
jgi:hypothetical protein